MVQFMVHRQRSSRNPELTPFRSHFSESTAMLAFPLSTTYPAWKQN